jgi:hypothetical protein
VSQPRDPDAISTSEASRAGPDLIDDADDLVPRDDVGPLWPKVAFGEVQVGATHAADSDPQPDLAGSSNRIGALTHRERSRGDRARFADPPRAHV